jgi:DNA-binding response OmpR family regulator
VNAVLGGTAVRQKRVLIVDGDLEIRDRAVCTLAALGYMTYVAATAEEALRISALRMPDALLTSVTLPDANGLELARQLRTGSADLLVIYMSGERDPVRVLGALHPNSGSLQKPFEPEELARTMGRLRLQRARAATSGRR